MGDVIQAVADAHRPTSWGNTCRCGWQGDNFSIHLIDMLGIEPVGYLPDGQDPDADWHSFARQDMEVGEPIYRIGGVLDDSV